MKKYLLLLTSVILLGSTSVVSAQVDNSARIAEIEEQIKELQAELTELKSDTSDSEAIIADDEEIFAKFVEIRERERNGEIYYDLFFEVENRTDVILEVQANTVSINNVMVPERIFSMSQEVAPGKKAFAEMTLRDRSREIGVPELTGNLEMTLHIFNWDDRDFVLDFPVIVNLDNFTPIKSTNN